MKITDVGKTTETILAMEAYFRQFFEGKLNILRNEFPTDRAERSTVHSGTPPRCTA